MKKLLLIALAGLAITASAALVRQPFYATGPKLVQTGTVVSSSDGTATNSFATAYSSAPTVMLTQSGAVNSPTNVVSSVTTTNFVVNCGKTTCTNNWTAIGNP